MPSSSKDAKEISLSQLRAKACSFSSDFRSEEKCVEPREGQGENNIRKIGTGLVREKHQYHLFLRQQCDPQQPTAINSSLYAGLEELLVVPCGTFIAPLLIYLH